jgi:beta-galactosidase beta subunit
MVMDHLSNCEMYYIAIVFAQDVHMPQKLALVGVPVRKACVRVRMA